MYDEWQYLYIRLNGWNRFSMGFQIRFRRYRSLVGLAVSHSVVYWMYVLLLGIANRNTPMQIFAVQGAGLSTVVIGWAVYEFLRLRFVARGGG